MESSLVYHCPDCSRALYFSGDTTTLIACTACGSVIHRDESGHLKARPQFMVSNKTEIIQPGSTGTWNDRPFTVLGRFRAWFEESVFNYWTIRFSDGETSWLGEGYGIYSLLSKPSVDHRNIRNMKTGDSKKLDDLTLVLLKKEKTIKWEIEGELYIPFLYSSFTIYEYASTDGKNITLFEFEKDIVRTFETQYVSFDSLQLKNLREFNTTGKSFTCKKCSKPILVKTYPYAQSCACTSCGTFYSLKDGMDFVKETSINKDLTVYLPLGSTGSIENIQYEVIGYAQKEEQNEYHSQWREYTLFNPQEGFAFLSEFDGHWIYIRENRNSPVLTNQNDKNFEFNKEPFLLYNAYRYTIIDAKGEFPYNVFDNKNTKAREFISPPEVWIEERNPQEGITWYFGQHIGAGEIERSFKVEIMPRRFGIGAVQPTGYISLYNLARATLIGILVLLFLHFFISNTKQERSLFDQTIAFPDSVNQVSLVTEKFVFDKWKSNLRFSIQAPVNNSWFELGATLVNAQTGKEYSLEKGVEYYFGYTGGENWTEGSQSADAYLTRIPAGTYFLQLQGTRDGYSFDKLPQFSLSITYDVPNTRNVIWSIVLLLLWPIGKYVFINYNEKSRWSNSPYSMYE